METPDTLRDAIIWFADFEHCREFMIELRWPSGKVACPTCGSEKLTWLPKSRVWKCYAGHARPTFSLKTGTIFEDSPLPLEKWLCAAWMLIGCKNGISSYEIHRGLGVTQKTAWFMLHRIRLAAREGGFNKIGGEGTEVEADETFVGGKIANMHKKSRRHERAKSAGTNWNKTIVLGLLEREGNVRAAVAPSRMKHHIEPFLQTNVEAGSKLYTDDLPVYGHVAPELKREFVNHLEGYVQGRVHTNGLENFWSLLKRGLKGTYVSVDPAHLQAYVDEQVFRFNNRKLTDPERFAIVMKQIVGRRLTYNELIGKTESGRMERPC
jgi:transposase-like protein